METKIEYICEQDGDVEREFKSKICKIFLNFGKQIRAYLVLAKYIPQDIVSVILSIRISDGYDEALLRKCSNVFRTMFSSNQHLDIMFISETEEKLIRKFCCPFYTSPSFNVQIPDFYVYSNDYHNLQDAIRNCYKRKRLYGGHSDGYLLCDIDPLLIGQSYGLGAKDITQLIFAVRHQRASSFLINESCLSVYVMRSLVNDIETKNFIEPSDVELIAWADIYQNENDISKISS